MIRLVVLCAVAVVLLGMLTGCRTYYGIGPAPTEGHYFITGRDAWGLNKIWEAEYKNGRFRMLRVVELGW
jgi:hypothetical protein